MLPILARSVHRHRADRTCPREAGSGPCRRLSSQTSVEGPVAPGIRTVQACQAQRVPPPGWTGMSRSTDPVSEQSTRTFPILPRSAPQSAPKLESEESHRLYPITDARLRGDCICEICAQRFCAENFFMPTAAPLAQAHSGAHQPTSSVAHQPTPSCTSPLRRAHRHIPQFVSENVDGKLIVGQAGASKISRTRAVL